MKVKEGEKERNPLNEGRSYLAHCWKPKKEKVSNVYHKKSPWMLLVILQAQLLFLSRFSLV